MAPPSTRSDDLPTSQPLSHVSSCPSAKRLTTKQIFERYIIKFSKGGTIKVYEDDLGLLDPDSGEGGSEGLFVQGAQTYVTVPSQPAWRPFDSLRPMAYDGLDHMSPGHSCDLHVCCDTDAPALF